MVQWEMLWYSAPTSLSSELLDHGVRHEQYNKVSGQYGHWWNHYLSFLEKRQPKNLLLGHTKSDFGALPNKMGSETRR